MFSLKNAVTVLALVAFAEARFGQENAAQGVISAIGGGEAATLGGASISTLLAGTNACDKLSLADQVAALGGQQALDAAKVLVQAEKNFNPFAVDRPNICSDPTLPATEELRGVIPLIDPAVEGSAAINAASADSLNNPLAANGLSVADLLESLGFATFNAQNSNGDITAPDVGGAQPPAEEEEEEEEEVAAPPPAEEEEEEEEEVAAPPPAEEEEEAADNVCPPPPECPAVAPPAAPAPAPPQNDNNNGNANTGDLQTFDGDLGTAAEPITFSGNNARPFQVAGDTFVNFSAAAARTCDRQFNRCADAANGGADFEVSDCNVQKTECLAAQASADVTSFARRKRSVYIAASLRKRATVFRA